MGESIQSALFSDREIRVYRQAWPAAMLFVVSSRKREVKIFQADDRVVSFRRDKLQRQIQLSNQNGCGWCSFYNSGNRLLVCFLHIKFFIFIIIFLCTKCTDSSPDSRLAALGYSGLVWTGRWTIRSGGIPRV